MAINRFCKTYKRAKRGVVQKITKLLNTEEPATSNTEKRKYTKRSQEPVTTTGRVVEIKGIKSIEFADGTLRFKF